MALNYEFGEKVPSVPLSVGVLTMNIHSCSIMLFYLVLLSYLEIYLNGIVKTLNRY